jgi:lactam utilization protein B
VLVRVVALAQRSDVDTICVHGDTPGAADLARQIRATLAAANIELRNLST